MNPLLKILISAVLIGIISEISKRNTSFAALIASLPLVSLLAMIWMYQDTRDVEKIAQFSTSVIWYVLPSLILFILLPVCLRTWHLPFYPSLILSSVATIAGFFVLKFVLARFRIEI